MHSTIAAFKKHSSIPLIIYTHVIIIILNFIAVTIGFNTTTYTVREELGFVTWRIVISVPVPSDTVLRLNQVTEGTATSM